ncbi:unnamed protein product [marine sediment metagenome]|uniref:Uncharacterized protein n=2 Tax=marine sediment metagenome TaxID=412755 RepID=X1KR58_9ZZZZ
MGILDRIFGERSRKRKNRDDPIMRYELYEKVPGGEWESMRYPPEAIDFNQVEDAMPGCSYRLYERKKSGKFGVLWFEHLEGPGPVQEETFTSFEDAEASLELLIRYGKTIGDLQESIRGAFGWAFPEKEQQRARDVGSFWLTVMDSAVDRANRIDLVNSISCARKDRN